VSSVVLALAFGLLASVSHFTLDQKVFVAATATWIALLFIPAIVWSSRGAPKTRPKGGGRELTVVTAPAR